MLKYLGFKYLPFTHSLKHSDEFVNGDHGFGVSHTHCTVQAISFMIMTMDVVG